MSEAQYRQEFLRELMATQDFDTARRRTLGTRARCFPHMDYDRREQILRQIEEHCATAVLERPPATPSAQ